MEYAEPGIDDLLEGSDDEVTLEGEDSEMPDVHDLLNMKTSGQSSKGRSLLPDLDLGHSDLDSSSDEEEAGSRRGEKVDNTEVKRERLIRMLSLMAPGLSFFPAAEKQDYRFSIFNLKSLSLERDCEYTRRGKLLGHGFSNERLDIILSDRLQFLRHLFPEAQSVLICDKNDFRSIMNFLLYSISVCTDEQVSDLITKAFFDLRRNYGFRWDLSLKHVATVLLNFGVSKNTMLDEKFYNKPNVGLLKHLEQVRKSGQDTETKFRMQKLPEFIQNRRIDQNSIEESVTAEQFNFCLGRFIQVICQFISGFPSHIDFKHKNNWSDLLVLMNILLLLGTERRLILTHRVKTDIREALHFLMESFSTELWRWGPISRPTKEEKERGETFNHYNCHKSLARMVHEFYPGELCPEVTTWASSNEVDSIETNVAGTSDHHLNMLHRINLIPRTHRGNQLRKYLAFMYLQSLAEVDNISLPTHVQVAELTDSLGLCDKLSDGIKMIVMSGNHGMSMTLLEFYDIIVGQEAEDFTEENVGHIKRLSKCVLGWFRKKLPSYGRSLDINNEKSVKALQLSEYLELVESRWKQGCNDF